MNILPTEIVYIAVNRWDSMTQREQHLLTGLSRTCRVLFVDPPLSFLTILVGKMKGEKRRFRSRIQRVSDQLIVYTPPAFPPFGQKVPWIRQLNTALLVSLIKGIVERVAFKGFILGIAWPLWAGTVKGLRPLLSYYDCSDDYSTFPGLKANREMLKRSEKELLGAVDLVFCSSQGLQGAMSRLHRNCFLIPNGVDMTSFAPESSGKVPPPDMQGIPKPILGYVGTIGEWVDFDGLIGLARARPDWSIVLIGPLTTGRFSSLMAGAPNIHWLGEKEYKRLPAYLTLFDVCLIPFKMDEFTEKIYPTKFHQYLDAGKPVVSSPLPELAPFGPWVEFYSDVKEMERKVERSLREDSQEKTLERRKVASENSWDRRVDSMIQVFNTFLGGQVGST
jgi:glycosyltransferase involved in cell wall biosynthesis